MSKKQPSQENQAVAAADAGKYRYIYVRKSVERRVHRRKLATVFLVFVLVALLLTGTVYAVLAFVDNNDFRITIERANGVLSLSEDASFSKSTTQLTTRGPSEMGDTSYNYLNFKQFRTVDGSHAQRDYYSSSFYLTNLGDDPCSYRELIYITDALNKLEDCIRVLVIREDLVLNDQGEFEQMSLSEDFSNMHWKCYAKARADGSAEQVAYTTARDGGELKLVTDPNPDAPDKESPWMCINFIDDSAGVVTQPEYNELAPHSRVRYTVAIWIEGTDEDTVDSRVGGSVTMSFGFTTLSTEEQTIS